MTGCVGVTFETRLRGKKGTKGTERCIKDTGRLSREFSDRYIGRH